MEEKEEGRKGYILGAKYNIVSVSYFTAFGFLQ